MTEPDARRQRLEACGASGPVVDELLAYGEPLVAGALPALPLADEPHVEAWLEYEADARREGVVAALRRRFVQLQFPIQAGISQTDEYRRATRQGRFEEAAGFAPLVFRRPDAIELTVHRSMGGRVPVVIAGDREDFVTLVQAFTARNEPEPVPPGMGACLVTGLNNWSRVAAHKAALARERSDPPEVWWPDAFRELAQDKARYQDRLILLSRGPYSGISAADVDLPEDEWLARSVVIRREHELTHYLTYRLFGRIRNHAVDELVADFIGMVRAFGQYPAQLARQAIGLAPSSGTRRLAHYAATPPLSAPALAVLEQLASRAIDSLDAISRAGRAPADDLSALATVVVGLFGKRLEAWGLGLEDGLGA